MDLVLSTWNGQNINNSSPFKSYFPRGQKANLSANAVTVNRAGDFPFLSDKVLNAPRLQIGVYIASGQAVNTNREVLKKYFNITDRQRHNLVALDADDSNKSYYVTGFPVAINNIGGNENEFAVTFALEYPYWQLTTATTDAWAITSSGDTQAITNAGNINVPPKFTFVPTTTKGGGLTYRRLVTIYNVLEKSLNLPFDVTDGGIDTVTLISGAKMQADGDDFRVWLDGAFADRWLNGVNDTGGTRCWINLSLASKKEGTLTTTVNDSATTLVFTQTAADLAFLRSVVRAQNQVLLIESELISLEGATVDLVGYQITDATRGAKGTTAATHTAPQTTRLVEHDIWILYGDSALGSQDVNDDYKPVFDLDSDNNSWGYTNFYDTDSNRPGAWSPEIQGTKTGLSHVFTGNQDDYANPSTKLGLVMSNGTDFQISNEAGLIDWLFHHPCGITDLVYSGDKYFNTTSWPGTAGLQYMEVDGTWVLAQTEAEPSSADSWESFGPRSISLGDTGDWFETVRFVMDGQLDSLVNETAKLQFDTLTATIYASNLPTISLGSEESINFFDITLTNTTTGQYLKVKTPCPVDDTLTVDCAKKEAYLSDGTPVQVTLSTDRENWLDLQPGSNTLSFTDADTVAVTGAVIHRDRVL